MEMGGDDRGCDRFGDQVLHRARWIRWIRRKNEITVFRSGTERIESEMLKKGS